jgi:hypothetical protein
MHHALLLLLLAASNPLKVGSAHGRVPIQDGDLKAATLRAKEAALNDAVTRAAGARLSPAVVAELGGAAEELLAHADRYVLHFEESPPDEYASELTVSLRDVMVDAEALTRDLDQLTAAAAKKPHPRVLLMLSETQGEEAQAWWHPGAGGAPSLRPGQVEQAVVAQLSPLGWHFVEPRAAADKLGKERLAKAEEVGDGLAVEFGKTVGADYLVYGTSNIRLEDNTNQKNLGIALEVAEGKLAARGVRVSRGEVAGAGVSYTNIKNDVLRERAIQLVRDDQANQVALVLVHDLLPDYARSGSGPPLKLEVAVESYEVLQAFEELLRQAGGATEVNEVSFGDGKAKLEVQHPGGGSKLAAAISGKAVGEAKLKVKVLKVAAQAVQVRLAK